MLYLTTAGVRSCSTEARIAVHLEGNGRRNGRTPDANPRLPSVLVCAACGEENPDRARYCLACAAVLEPDSTGEERKVVSVLFVDLAGFTARSDEADPEDVRALLRPYHARLKQEIERFGGTVEKFIGDAVVAVFGAPVAHEDDAERAVRAALRITEAIEELNEEHPHFDLMIRAAVNTGPAVVALGARPERGEGIATGDVVNTASRMQQAAPVGGVVVGPATFKTTSRIFDYEELDPIRAKGKAEPIPIWRARGARSRFGVDLEGAASAFIGRDEDLALLRQSFTRMLRESSVQLVTIIGEPGVGKSRLIAEFFSYVDSLPDLVFWRQGRCLPYGDGITFWALGEIVKAQTGILESDGPDEAAAKLKESVDGVVEDAGEREWIAARLAPLVGVGADPGAVAERDESFAAWRAYLESVAATRPLVLVVEDLHWADGAMFEFLAHVVDWSTDLPILLLCSARPELSERAPGWGGGTRNSTTISLSPLSAEDSARLISVLLDQAVLPAETQTLLLERAGGNPLYAEEFVRMLVDRGLIGRRGHSWVVDPESMIPVPESVQALIAARLDSLPQDQKALLHDASVVGKVFWSGALSAVGGVDDAAVREGLHELARRELVRPARRSSVENQAEYSFWHLFIRDVAYEQIPRAARADRHRGVAEWIEEIAGDRVGDQAEVLAHHYGQALELARAAGNDQMVELLEARTVRFLVMAGDRARPLDAPRARRHLAAALLLLPAGHPERAGVLVKDAMFAYDTGNYDESEEEFLEAIADLRGRREILAAGEAMVELANTLWPRGDTARAWPILREGVEMLEGETTGRELALGYHRMAGAHMMAGLNEEGMPWAEKALALARELGNEEYVARILQFRGIFRCELGDLRGMDDLREGLRRCKELGLGQETVAGSNNLGDWVWFEQGPAAGLEVYRDGIEFGERRGLAGPVAWAKAQTLWTLFDLGRWDELLRVGDEAVEDDRTGGGGQVTVMARTYQARVLVERGRVDQAAALTPEFFPRAREIGDPQVMSPALAVAALVDLRDGRPDAAVSLVEEFDRSTERYSSYRSHLLPDLLRISVATGRLDLAERVAEQASGAAARFRHAAITARAILAEAGGRIEEAVSTYLEASDRWTEYGFVLERGHALLGAGRCQLELGRTDPATERLREARVVFAELGAEPSLAEIDDLLQRATALSS